jgi:pimeloyl-ACP methyl ester carboxylesterase
MVETRCVNRNKQVVAVLVTAVIVATVFGTIGPAVATPNDATTAEHATSTIAARPDPATSSGFAPLDVTDVLGCQSISLKTTLQLEQAAMVSPNELGVGVSVAYPVSESADGPRYVAFTAVINGKPVAKAFNVTQYTASGVRWGRASGAENEMFDAGGTLKPTTPLRINLTAEGVPRFTDNVNFTLTARAFAGERPCSDASSIAVTIPLPVVIVEGLPSTIQGTEPIVTPILYYTVYKPLTDFILNAGNDTVKYNKETEWNSYKTDLRARGYSTQRYVTLWDTYAPFRNPQRIIYTTPRCATPDTVKADIDTIVKEHVWPYSHASKCNLVCYSFGGLVGRYYASVAPQNVNTVIAVGPHYRGDTLVYEWIFGGKLRSRAEVERWMSVPNTKTPSIQWWDIPTYDCLITPDYLPVNPYFNNTYSAPPASGVKYYSIYIDGEQALPTDEKVTITYVKDRQWYSITNITQGRGDALVLAKSAASFGDQYPAQVVNQPVSVRCSHVFLLRNPEIQAQIYRDLWAS